MFGDAVRRGDTLTWQGDLFFEEEEVIPFVSFCQEHVETKRMRQVPKRMDVMEHFLLFRNTRREEKKKKERYLVTSDDPQGYELQPN